MKKLNYDIAVDSDQDKALSSQLAIMLPIMKRKDKDARYKDAEPYPMMAPRKATLYMRNWLNATMSTAKRNTLHPTRQSWDRQGPARVLCSSSSPFLTAFTLCTSVSLGSRHIPVDRQ